MKFAFFRVPKTGSTTAEALLRLSGAFDQNDYMTPNIGLNCTLPAEAMNNIKEELRGLLVDRGPARMNGSMFDHALESSLWSYVAHLTPAEAIRHKLITLEQLKEYKSFAFLRNPAERHLSAFAHLSGSTTVLPDQYHKAVLEDKIPQGILTKPSVDYFLLNGEQVLQPLWFSDYDSEIQRVIGIAGGYIFKEIPRLNPSRGTKPIKNKERYFTAQVNKKLAKVLADDIKFFFQMINGQ